MLFNRKLPERKELLTTTPKSIRTILLLSQYALPLGYSSQLLISLTAPGGQFTLLYRAAITATVGLLEYTV